MHPKSWRYPVISLSVYLKLYLNLYYQRICTHPIMSLYVLPLLNIIFVHSDPSSVKIRFSFFIIVLLGRTSLHHSDITTSDLSGINVVLFWLMLPWRVQCAHFSRLQTLLKGSLSQRKSVLVLTVVFLAPDPAFLCGVVPGGNVDAVHFSS